MNKVLIVIGDAAETLDTLYPYYRLQEDGFEPVVAAPEKRRYQMVMHEIKPGWTITKEWEGYTLEANVAFSEIQPEEYVGIMFSGGRAPEYIRYDKNLCRVVREIAEAGKPIACLCHGIEILTAAKCIQGKRVTTVPKCAMDAEQGGAEYVDEDVVVDGLLVTGRGYGQNTEVLKQFLRMLKTDSAR
jgi:protease I